MAGIVHVGAWRGLEYLESDAPLILFEPQAEAFARLSENFLGRDNVQMFNVALGAVKGSATMFTAEPNHSSSLLVPIYERGEVTFDGTEQVEMTTLDSVMAGRTGYDELRIDTQGYELEVLKGGVETLADIDRIEIEIHDPMAYRNPGSLEAIDALLVDKGFTRTEYRTDGDDLGDAVYERKET